MAKLNRDQKRAKEKKAKARATQLRKEHHAKTRKSAGVVFSLLEESAFTNTPLEYVAFGNAFNNMSPASKEATEVTTIRGTAVLRNIQQTTCALLALHDTSYENAVDMPPLGGRYYSVFNGATDSTMDALALDWGVISGWQFEDFGKNIFEMVDKSMEPGSELDCVVYFTGHSLDGAKCHTVSFYDRFGNAELYIVTPSSWIRMQDATEVARFFSDFMKEASMGWLRPGGLPCGATRAAFEIIAQRGKAKAQSQDELTLEFGEIDVLSMAANDGLNETEQLMTVAFRMHQNAVDSLLQDADVRAEREYWRGLRAADQMAAKIESLESQLRNARQVATFIPPTQTEKVVPIQPVRQALSMEQRLALIFDAAPAD